MKLNRTISFSTILITMLLASPIQAEHSSFSFLEVQSAQIDHSDVDSDGGFGIEFSLSFADNWYVTGNNTENDFTFEDGTEGEYTNWLLGIGHYWSLSDSNDIYLQLSAETQKLKVAAGNIDERGASIEFGSIYQLNESWNFTAHARYSDINITSSDDRSEEFYFGGRFDYAFSDQLQIGLGYEAGDFDRLDLALRFNF